MNLLRTAIEQALGKAGVIAVAAALFVMPGISQGVPSARAADGMSAQILASAPAVENGSQLVVARIMLEPGVELWQHHQAGPATFAVISGAMQTTLVRGGAAVDRNGIELDAAIGATMNLTAGQSISYSPYAVKTIANRTSKPLVLLVSMLLDPDEPMVSYDDWSPLFQPDFR